MDVNVPHYITHEEVRRSHNNGQNVGLPAQDTDPFIPGFTERKLQEQVESLVCYLWDNFLQMYDADELFLMGVGTAYVGVKMLLTKRGKMVP